MSDARDALSREPAAAAVNANVVLAAEIEQYEHDVDHLRRLIANEKLLLSAEAQYHPSKVALASSGAAAESIDVLRANLKALGEELADTVSSAAEDLDHAGLAIGTSSASLSRLSAHLAASEADVGGPRWVSCAGIAKELLKHLAEADVIEWDGGDKCRRHPSLHLDSEDSVSRWVRVQDAD